MPNLHESILIIFFFIAIGAFIMAVKETLENVDSLDEDENGFYDKRDRV